MANGNDKMKKQSKWRQYIGAPKRFLSKARDFYVDSMVSLDGKLANNNTMLVTCPAPHISQILPQKNNTNNLIICEENLLALYRSSMKYGESSNGKKDQFEGLNRSYSVVGLGRIDTIDEDKHYEFHEDHSIIFARSRSHAVTFRTAYY